MGLTARARLSRRLRARATDERGFTLPELLVTMAILLIVIASLASVLVSATKSQVDANNRFQAQEQARTGVTQLVRELHCAGSVTQTSGTALTTGTAYAAITTQLSSACPSSGGVTEYATWCTSPSTLNASDFALYRVTSTSTRPTCASSGKVKWADYLTTSTPFCLPATSATAACPATQPANSLPLLHVMFPVNLKGPGAIESYNVVDDIALRNGVRS